MNRWVALADLDGWGEETMLLAKLIAMKTGTAPIDHLPGWDWLKKEKHNG